jgi:hypothetical protein
MEQPIPRDLAKEALLSAIESAVAKGEPDKGLAEEIVNQIEAASTSLSKRPWQNSVKR